MSDFIVNSFQVPNAVVDKLMAWLSGLELKSLLLYFRYEGNVPKEIIRANGLQDLYERIIFVLRNRGIL